MSEEYGILEGEVCGRDGCKGLMCEADDDTVCSCHIAPPCTHCVEMRLECNECGYETESPSDSDCWNSGQALNPTYKMQAKKTDAELFAALEDNKFGYVSIAGKHYWMEAKGKYPEGMTADEILGKFNTCFGYKWLSIPKNGQFHLKYYTD